MYEYNNFLEKKKTKINAKTDERIMYTNHIFYMII